MPLDKIKFETNEPTAVILRHPAGKIVDGRFGQQVYYTLASPANSCMYVELDVAQKINLLEVQAGEVIVICKRNSKVCDVWLSPETEKMRAAKDYGSIEQRLRASVTAVNENRYATMRVPVLVGGGAGASVKPRAGADTPAPAAATQTNSNGHSNNGNSITRTSLSADAIALVDAFAAVLDYSLTTYQGRIKPEDVRSLLVTVFIGRQKGGSHA
jgi:hypothetical protein